MKAIFISQKKPIGSVGFIIFLIAFSAMFWYLNQVYDLFDLLLNTFNLVMLPTYMQYVFIAICALVSAFVLKTMIKQYQLKKLKLKVFSVNLALDGSYHYVQAPSAQTVADFLKLFFKYLVESSAKDKYSAILKQYFPMLEIRRNDELIRCETQQTLAEAGLKDGDICQIVGKPKNTA